MQYKSATQQVMLWNTTVGIKENIEPLRREGGKFFFRLSAFPANNWSDGLRAVPTKKTPQVRNLKFIY